MEIGPISKVMNILTIKKRYSSDPPQLVMVVRFPCVGDLAEPTVVIMFQRSQHLEKLDLLQNKGNFFEGTGWQWVRSLVVVLLGLKSTELESDYLDSTRTEFGNLNQIGLEYKHCKVLSLSYFKLQFTVQRHWSNFNLEHT